MKINRTEHQKSIAILICYMGKLPWYFDYLIHSCKFNQSIDFFVLTNNNYHKEVSSNVRFIYLTLANFVEIATKKLGLAVQIEDAYKLCDYKPTFGLLFSDILDGYDFWGQSDIDVIYGDIRGFMTDELLDSFDFISVRHDYTTGCFSLSRNNSFMNEIFKKSKDYEKVFSNGQHFCFDECNFAYAALSEGKPIFEVPTEIESFTHVIRRAEINDEIRAHFDFILLEGVPGKIKFNKGKITYKNSFEAILYHLIWLKRVYTPEAAAKIIPDTFYVSPNRIYSRK